MGERIIIYSNGEQIEVDKDEIEIYEPFPKKEEKQETNPILILEE